MFLAKWGGGVGWLLAWTSFGCFGSPDVPIAAFQLAPLAGSDLGADVRAHAMIAGLGRLGLLRPGIRNPNGKITDEQPSQNSKLHQAPLFTASATLWEEVSGVLRWARNGTKAGRDGTKVLV